MGRQKYPLLLLLLLAFNVQSAMTVISGRRPSEVLKIVPRRKLMGWMCHTDSDMRV